MLGMEPIIIYQSKAKALLFFIIKVLLMFATYFLGINESVKNFSPGLSQFFLYIAAPFFGLITLYAALKLAMRSRGLLIDNEGITDSLFPGSVGLLKWGEIDRIFYNKVSQEEYLGVAPKEPKEILRRLNFWQKRVLKGKGAASLIFINIPQKKLPMNVDEFITNIRKFHPEIRILYPFPIFSPPHGAPEANKK